MVGAHGPLAHAGAAAGAAHTFAGAAQRGGAPGRVSNLHQKGWSCTAARRHRTAGHEPIDREQAAHIVGCRPRSVLDVAQLQAGQDLKARSWISQKALTCRPIRPALRTACRDPSAHGLQHPSHPVFEVLRFDIRPARSKLRSRPDNGTTVGRWNKRGCFPRGRRTHRCLTIDCRSPSASDGQRTWVGQRVHTRSLMREVGNGRTARSLLLYGSL